MRHGVRRLLGSALILTLMLVTSCAGNTPGSSSFCLIYRPIYMAEEDTEATKRQIDDNNAAYEELCADRV
jgi:hypothetical protein